ncbi:hypothetical protein VPH35_100049 [Triticum aestivum]
MPPPPPGSRGRGRGRGVGSPVANPVATSLGTRGHHLPLHPVLHFDVPIINGRVIVSVDSHGLLAAAARSGLDDGPMVFVDIDMDGNFLTDHRVPGEPLESNPRRQCEKEEEDHVAEPACARTMQEQDLSSLEDLLNATTLEESAQPWRCLSSSPIWALAHFDWGIIFFTRVDLKGSFHTNPHVGGPFQSLQEAHDAIDRYLQEHRHPTIIPVNHRIANHLSTVVKHPDNSAAYTGAKASSQCACSLFGNMGLPVRDESLEEEERRVRRFYETQGLDDPDYVEKERARAQMTIRPFSPDDCVPEYRAVPTTGKSK